MTRKRYMSFTQFVKKFETDDNILGDFAIMWGMIEKRPPVRNKTKLRAVIAALPTSSLLELNIGLSLMDSYLAIRAMSTNNYEIPRRNVW